MPVIVKESPSKASVAPKKEDEKWRNSSIHPELMVSSLGRVRTRPYQRLVKDEGDGWRIYEVAGQTLEQKVNQDGNIYVGFYSCKHRAVITESVNLLVAKEFVKNEDPQIYTRIRHLDRNKANVKAANLMWDGVGIHSKTF